MSAASWCTNTNLLPLAPRNRLALIYQRLLVIMQVRTRLAYGMDSGPAAVSKGSAAVGAAPAANAQQTADAAPKQQGGAASQQTLRGGAAGQAPAQPSTGNGSAGGADSASTAARQQSGSSSGSRGRSSNRGASHAQQLTIRRVLRETLQAEGVAGLYRGIGPTIVGILPYAGLKFYVYQSLKQHYRAASGQVDDHRLPVPLMLTFGALAGLVGQVGLVGFNISGSQYYVSRMAIVLLTTLWDVTCRADWQLR